MSWFDYDACAPELSGGGTWPRQRLPRLIKPIQIGLEAVEDVFVLRIDPLEPTVATAVLAEFGDTVGMRTGPGSLVTIEAKNRDDALAFVAERLRRYVAGIRRIPVDELERPELGLVDSLLARSGYLRIRPIETEVYSTSIDIGIGTDPGEAGPADTSVVYDLCSGTWHGE